MQNPINRWALATLLALLTLVACVALAEAQCKAPLPVTHLESR
jgi:hypothetical protein